MKFLYSRFIFLSLLLILLGPPLEVRAQVGFQADLDNPPLMVSSYKQPKYTFSAAMHASTTPMLGIKMERKPALSNSDFANHSFTFQTLYYKYRNYTKYLVPVSVDVGAYNDYRRRLSEREQLTGLYTRNISNPDERSKRRGLGISVALPKRLDRIFGEGGAGLKVSGYRRITFAGRSQWVDAANTESYQQDKFPSLSMEQISKFDITGNIGSKITVRVNQDSQTDIPLANRIQIRYKGEEDEILQSIEAGNTNLSLPNTKFVGYSQRINGLFGLKAEAQVGSLHLTGIASQEKGSAERSNYSPDSDENADFIRDWQYAQGRVYDIGRLGADSLRIGDSVTTLYVYEQERDNDRRSETDKAIMYVDPSNPGYLSDESQTPINGVNKLEDNYVFYSEPSKNRHYMVFTSAHYTYSIGVWMVVKRAGSAVPDTIGNISSDTLFLKLIRPEQSLAGPEQATWDLMWRNVYSMPRGAIVDELDIKVFKGLSGSETQTTSLDFQKNEGGASEGQYIEILGLDQYNTLDQNNPDNKVDDRLEVFRSDWGLLIFPDREPFNTDTIFTSASGATTAPLRTLIPTIYRYRATQELTNASQYFIRTSTKTRSSIIKLNRTNIIEGSERVAVNGRTLGRDTDYNIDYDFGQITLLSDEALDPNADLDIDYEFAPFFTLQKKTLLGVRAEYEWSKDFKFGGTILYKSDKTQDRKPRVGQETATHMVFDLDADLRLQPNFLTTMVDALPFVDARSPSNIQISGEVAQSRPNPNTEGAAYIDDFEAALDKLTLGTSRTLWHLASRPLPLKDTDYQRGKILWHSPRDLVDVQEIYDIEARPGEGTVRTLRLINRPRNFSVDTVTVEAQPSDTTFDTTMGLPSFAGIMRYFNSRVDAKRARLFEVRAKAGHGKLHFDFGEISEDLDAYGPPNGSPYSEDGSFNGAANGFAEPEEDIGLDGKADADEPGYNEQTNPDPDGDNWYFDGEGKCPLPPGECNNIDWDDESIRYEWINGTEGNIRDFAVTGRPDQEVLGSGFNTANAYFSFTIDFASDSFLVEGTEYNGWRTYRIPIRDSAAISDIVMSGTREPNWANITHVRVWFESSPIQTAFDTVEIADWYFVQTNWQDSLVVGAGADSSTSFVAASVSEEDLTFVPPPGVQAYVDPTSDVAEPQRGLALIFSDLSFGDTCFATKDLISVDRYSGYGRMEMYVRADIQDEDSLFFFFRIGRDASNFYEYHHILSPDPTISWPESDWVNMDFAEVTQLKDEALRAGLTDTSSERYRVLGNPNLNEIRYFVAGIVNLNQNRESKGQVWLDELRVTDVRKDIGNAGRLSVSGNLSDLVTYRYNIESQDAFFRGLSAATRGGSTNNLGSGETNTTYSYGASLRFDKFLPKSWGASIPISYNASRSVRTPLLRNNSDILLSESRRQAEQSISENKSISVSESFSRRGGNPLFSLLLNRLSTNFSYRRGNNRSVNQPYQFSENINVRGNFDMGVRKAPTIPIFYWTKWIPIAKKTAENRLSLYPSVWRLDGSYNRTINVSDDINFQRRTTFQRTFDGNMSVNHELLSNLSTSLRFTTRNDLSDPDLVSVRFGNFRLGQQLNFSQTFSARYDPKLFGFFTTVFDYSTSYRDDYDRSSGSRRSTLTRNRGVSGKFDHMQLFGRSRGPQYGGTSRRNVRGGGARGEEEGGRKIWDYPLAALRFLTGWIQPFSYTYSETFNNSVPGMLTRPDLAYRFGLRREADIPIVSQTLNPSSSEGQRYSTSSGFTLFGGIATTIKYQRSISRDLVKQGSRSEGISTTWPDVSVRISRFTSFPLIKGMINKFIEVFGPRTGFSRQTQETKLLDAGFTTAQTTSWNYAPLLQVNFRPFRDVSVSAQYQLNKDESRRFNPTTGVLQSETLSSRKSFGLNGRYSFTAPGGINIPLFGKVRFRSTATLDLTIRKNSDYAETSSNSGPYVTSTDRSDLTVTPVVSYQFSSQIKGGLTARWQDTTDKQRSRTSHIRELQIWVELRF